MLARNKGRIFPSSEIYERVWGQEFLENDNSLLTHIRNLREKLSDTVKTQNTLKLFGEWVIRLKRKLRIGLTTELMLLFVISLVITILE